jgi:hypothetical protein
MIRLFLAASFFALAVGGGAAPAMALCKDQCVKHCMGNDTPTERANCLKREKCDDQPACTGSGGVLGSSTGTLMLDPGSPPPKPKFQLPLFNRSDAVIQ